MDLTKKAIEELRFTKRHRRCYDAMEIDDALDKIAEMAEKQHEELLQLRAVRDEYNQMKMLIGETLLSAQQYAEELKRKTEQICNEELAQLDIKKRLILDEIIKLEQYRDNAIQGLRYAVERFLSGLNYLD